MQNNIQNVAQAAVLTNNNEFFARTSNVRKGVPGYTNKAWSGLGGQDSVVIPKVGLCGNLYVTVEGEIVVPATPTVRPLWAWIWDVLDRAKFAANGVSLLIDAPGAWLKAREIVGDPYTTDRGISRPVAGVARMNGTLATTEADVYPFGPNAAFTTAGTYPFRITYKVPVCLEDTFMTGLIYAQSTNTNITLDLLWAPQAKVFDPTGTQPTFQNVTYSVEQDQLSIPTAESQGKTVLVVPDLSQFHVFRYNNDVITAQGRNEYRVAAVGPGKQLQRLMGRVMNNTLVYGGAIPTPTPVPLLNTAAATIAGQKTYDEIALLYGSNDEIRRYTGAQLLTENEKNYGSCLGWLQGIWVFDLLDKGNALRDTRDEGACAELRFALGLNTNVAIAQPARVEYCVEEVLAASSVA
jgi:hypothetical protein